MQFKKVSLSHMVAFQELLSINWKAGRFFCVGLDSDSEKIPKSQTQFSFNKAIIESTHDLVAAYKPNIAFYESLGSIGWETLKQTITLIHEIAPQRLVILDAKRADIGNTSAHYATAAFEEFQADAITLNPYMGQDSLQPFLDYKEKGCFILCRTSNPGSKEFQDLNVDGKPLYLQVAENVANRWNAYNNCGLVVGATFPNELKKIREVAPNLPFLIPGVGAQGGEAKEVLENARDKNGEGFLINVSRSVLFASSGPDFALMARGELVKLSKL